MSSQQTTSWTLIFSSIVCVVCAVFVSFSAILLKEDQERNQQLLTVKKILAATGFDEQEVDSMDGDQALTFFKSRIGQAVVDLDSGYIHTILTEEESLADYQHLFRSDMQLDLSKEDDIARIRKRERFAPLFFLLNEETKAIEKLVLRVRGYGLWSIMSGYVTLSEDLNTIQDVIYVEHKETPGLGGEIDNPVWQSQWVGKKLYGPEDDYRFSVQKNADPNSEYYISAISGATLTSRGVDSMMAFWFKSDLGFARLIRNLSDADGCISCIERGES